MGLIRLLFRRKNVYQIRKEYDHLREKTDLEQNTQKRLEVLRLLDQVEPTIVMLEEQFMSGYEKKRMIFRVEEGMKRARFLLEDKESFRPLVEEARK